ncbi:phage head-tail adapter protein [Burkholderia aenigmatica]|uniref:Phage head-tail adapter protein n=1 Tax=Burkholderia aenigmatica TaxID=2015348 RepID=A0ABY6XY45_9BURK|nr:gpW family head-tail joining protein [Burkholderia aenigmatica]VWC78877.1 phage head-tail adapter protein [Burkholderia aenigmatica]
MAITDGMSTADMQSRLAALQAAYFDLASGVKIVTATYNQGDGTKSVTYKPSDLTQVMKAIEMLQKALGLIPRYHRARRPLF